VFSLFIPLHLLTIYQLRRLNRVKGMNWKAMVMACFYDRHPVPEFTLRDSGKQRKTSFSVEIPNRDFSNSVAFYNRVFLSTW
jgi:hypothetical protein